MPANQMIGWEFRRWTKVIAWLQMIGSVIGIIASSIDVGDLNETEKELSRDYSHKAVSGARTVLIIAILYYIVGIGMGGVLLSGTYQNRVMYIRIWIFYAIFSIIFSFILVITSSNYGVHFVRILLTVGAYTFALFVVNTFLDELNMFCHIGSITWSTSTLNMAN